MKVLTSAQAVHFSNSGTCQGVEYPFADKDLNIALVTVDGRYPAEGHLVNEVCKEVAYVVSGTGMVGVDDETHQLEPGAAVLIQPGERFFWEGDKLTMLMPCSPAFYPDQHKEVA